MLSIKKYDARANSSKANLLHEYIQQFGDFYVPEMRCSFPHPKNARRELWRRLSKVAARAREART